METTCRPGYVNKKILIVDDDQWTAVAMASTLEATGYRDVTVTHSGREALELMTLEHLGNFSACVAPPPFDVILLDIMLPNTNGFEICRKIRTRWGSRIAIILITGFDIENHHARYIESGADDFLNKPIDPKELLHRLDVQLCLHERSKYSARPSPPHSPLIDACTMEHIGPYTIHRTMSWSGAVVIYEADLSGDDCVIKIMTKQAMEHKDMEQRFLREEELLASFHHPNIIRFLDRGTYHNLEYFVTEYINGKSLDAYSMDNPKLGFEFVKGIALASANALAYIHDQGVIHRDLKLKNLFLSEDESTVKIGDFGIAFVKGNPRLTQPGFSIGTPIYMAPEQFQCGDISPALDIYSFGATLYHLSTGVPPYSAGNAMALMRKHIEERPRPITESRPEFPPEWNALIVDRCMARAPGDRPASMSGIIRELRAMSAA